MDTNIPFTGKEVAEDKSSFSETPFYFSREKTDEIISPELLKESGIEKKTIGEGFLFEISSTVRNVAPESIWSAIFLLGISVIAVLIILCCYCFRPPSLRMGFISNLYFWIFSIIALISGGVIYKFYFKPRNVGIKVTRDSLTVISPTGQEIFISAGDIVNLEVSKLKKNRKLDGTEISNFEDNDAPYLAILTKENQSFSIGDIDLDTLHLLVKLIKKAFMDLN